MTLQRKFVLIVGMLGVTLLGSLAAVWWSFSFLQSEQASPFSQTAGVLECLRRIKQNVQDQADIVYSRGTESTDAGDVAAGVRVPRAEPVPFIPDAEEAGRFRALNTATAELMREIETDEAFTARIGISTSRNLGERVRKLETLSERWIANAGGSGALDQQLTGEACYLIHGLIESAERLILDNARSAVGHGARIRGMLTIWLLSVFGVGLLGCFLGVALLRRWVQRPVSRLREAAARIAQGDLQHRVPVEQKDELGMLSAEVNHMAQMVQVMQDERVERERLAAVGTMVRRIVHNVRNPLSGIRGLAEVTRLDFDKGSVSRENLDLIVSTVDQFERWLSELLDATAPAGIAPRTTPVGAWIDGIIEVHRPQAQARNIALHIDAAGAPQVATFDPKHLDHAVSALVSNAIEATPEGSQVWVTARRVENDGLWEVEVADAGPGISAQAMPHMFEPQFTTKARGNGLGLAMAQQIVKGHQGRITVRNGDSAHPERRGACFTIRLPVEARAPVAGPNTPRSV